MSRSNIVRIALVGGGFLVAWGLLSGGPSHSTPDNRLQEILDMPVAPTAQEEAEQDSVSRQEALFAYIAETDVPLGETDAPVLLVEFGDYQCTFCAKFFNETKNTLVSEYVETGKLKYIFRDFPVNGRESQQAAEASECAAEQGFFWEYHDRLYQERTGYNTGAFSKANLVTYASELGLDSEAFTTCYEEGRYKDEISKDMREGRALGVTGTPTFIINGQKLVGAQPTSVFVEAIEMIAAQGAVE